MFVVSIALALCAVIHSTPAQDFVFTRVDAPAQVSLGSNIVYSLSLSNATPNNFAQGAITSSYDANGAEFVDATNAFAIFTNAGSVRFEWPLNSFPGGAVLDIRLELRATTVGELTNVFVATTDDMLTLPATNKVVTSVATPEADLGVSIRVASNGLFPGDLFDYELLATNAGPATASGVLVSNWFPGEIISVTNTTPPSAITVSSNFVLFTVDTLAKQGSARATVSALALTAAQTNLVADISAVTVTDTNLADNTNTAALQIHVPDTNQFTVSALTGQRLNLQTGWIEQRVRVQNTTTAAVESVRLLVDDLTNALVALVNATGTNWATPYVAHGASVSGTGHVDLTLEYESPTRDTTGTDPTWRAYGTPALDLSPHPGSETEVKQIYSVQAATMNQGRILLEWSVTNGVRYQVIYDGTADFRAAKGSLPLITPPNGANRAQWLDYGPPRTLIPPREATSIFYKVIVLP